MVGRLCGISGIVGGLVDGSDRSEWLERALFIAGLIAAPWLAITLFGLTPQTNITQAPVIIIAAGLLVGDEREPRDEVRLAREFGLVIAMIIELFRSVVVNDQPPVLGTNRMITEIG